MVRVVTYSKYYYRNFYEINNAFVLYMISLTSKIFYVTCGYFVTVPYRSYPLRKGKNYRNEKVL